MENQNNIFIGTSGWSYKHWKGVFYPDGLSQKNWLKFYCQNFRTVELNNTFYRLPEEHTYINWKGSVPEDFKFSVKISRFITHVKRLENVEDSLSLFLQRVKLLENKLGVILFQFPTSFKYDPERLKKFLPLLPGYFRYSFEFRNTSWWVTETFDLLNKYGITFCIYEMPERLTPREVTSDIVYIRFHSPFANYTQFEKSILLDWSEFILDCASKGKKVYCYFNNDWLGYAIQDSIMLKDIINNKLSFTAHARL